MTPEELDRVREAESELGCVARTYAYAGWHVFPCKPRGKTPLTQHGVDDATTDEELIINWWRLWPDANIGIATGPSGLAVLDVDAKSGGLDSFRELHTRGRITETIHTFTGGGGVHLY